MSNEPANYRPNVKLALSTIAIKWDARGKPLDYLLDASDADLVIDSLLADGWSIIPTETAAAAREVVETHTEVTELTGVLEAGGPRFVQVGPNDWVNPDMVAQLRQFVSADAGPTVTLLSISGAYLTNVDGTAAEVVALLSAVPS